MQESTSGVIVLVLRYFEDHLRSRASKFYGSPVNFVDTDGQQCAVTASNVLRGVSITTATLLNSQRITITLSQFPHDRYHARMCKSTRWHCLHADQRLAIFRGIAGSRWRCYSLNMSRISPHFKSCTRDSSNKLMWGALLSVSMFWS